MKATNKYYCPYCGAEHDIDDDREAFELLRAKAEKIGYSVRRKAGRTGFFEILSEYGFSIAEGTSVRRLAAFLDALSVPLTSEVRP